MSEDPLVLIAAEELTEQGLPLPRFKLRSSLANRLRRYSHSIHYIPRFRIYLYHS